jgi:hypothetical protein
MEETPGGALAAQVGYAADLVREYERFIQIKTDAEDWTSMVMSPPMHRDPITGLRLIDEVCTVSLVHYESRVLQL